MVSRAAPRTAAPASAAAARPTAADLPWLAAPLADALAQQRAHALLVHGAEGVGQFEFTLALAQSWLCETPLADRPQRLACGRCAACHLVDERSHPDLRLIVPEGLRAAAGLDADDAGGDDDGKKRKPSQEIKVEQIRAAVDFSALTAARGGVRVLVVHPAEALNHIAANALLKTLEEPPGALRFVLSSGSPQNLLPTLRSRCQAVRLAVPAPDAARAWLEAQGVADAAVLLDAAGQQPLAALAHAQAGRDAAAWRQLPRWVAQGDAAALTGWPLPVLVDALQKLCHDRLRATVGAPARYFTTPDAGLRAGDLPALTAWGAALRRHAAQADHPWNAGLAMEALLLEARAVDGPAARGRPIHSFP